MTLIERGRQPRLAAEDIGFAYSTVRQHLSTDREFALAVQDAADLVTDRVVEVALDMATSGDNSTMTRYWLNNRRQHEWQDAKVSQVQVTGAGGGPIQLATGSVEMWRQILSDPDARADALAFAGEIPAIEATARET